MKKQMIVLRAKVEWFDALRGIGEAMSLGGQAIHLCSEKIVPIPNKFTNLVMNEYITCKVVKNDLGEWVAEIIEREVPNE